LSAPRRKRHLAGRALQVLDIELPAARRVEERCERLIENLRGRKPAGVEIGEASGEQVPARRRDQALIQDTFDALDARRAVCHIAREELQDLHDIRGIPRGQRRRHAAADEDPQGLLDLEGPKGRALLAVESLLLEERQQARHQVHFKVLPLRSLVEVQDLVVLAEAVAVEVAVRVIEQRALGVQIGELRPALDRLPESGRVLERKALLAQRVAKAHPRALFTAAGAAVALVHQHQVVALEGVHGDGLVAHLVAQPGHFEDLHRLAGEQPRPSLLNSSASMPAASNSRRCCWERPSFGVSRRMRFSSRRRPCVFR
jgi:hypothetical protein